MYDAMLARWSNQQWWPTRADAGPAEKKLEICVGAILTQNTNWLNVEKALANLVAAGAMSISALDDMPPRRLAELIRPAGYFNVKARRLKNFVSRARGSSGDDIRGFLSRPVEVLRRELLGVNGIGPETADSMILYAAGGASFVVDSYTRRVCVRHGLVATADYDAVKAFFEQSLPVDVELWKDYHAQLVAVGKHYCRPAPQCRGCPLEAFSHAVAGE